MGYVENARALASVKVEADERRDDASGRAIAWLTVIYWFANAAIFTIANAFSDTPNLLLMTGTRFALAVFGIGLCFALRMAFRRLERRALWKRVLVLLLLIPLAAETYAWLSYFGLSWAAGEKILIHPNISNTMTTIATWSWFFLGWAGLALAVEYAFDARDEELRASRFESLAQTAKLHALHNQINPHFLFNSLNSIAALVGERRVDAADRMIDLLASYLRRTLAADPHEDVALSDEIDLQLEYLAIEQARYPDLQIEVDLPAELKTVAIPALLLQPLLENAVKHGVANAMPPTKIAIRAHRERDGVAISVENGPATQSSVMRPGTGIGLRNVRERLMHRFGGGQRLRAAPLEGGGYAQVIYVPLEHV